MADKIEDWQRRFLDGKGYASAVVGEQLLEPTGMEMLHTTFGTYDIWTATNIHRVQYAISEKAKVERTHDTWARNKQGPEPKLDAVYKTEIELLERALASHGQNRGDMIKDLTAGQLLDYYSAGGNPIVNIPGNLLAELNAQSSKKYSELAAQNGKLAGVLGLVDYYKVAGKLHGDVVKRYIEGNLVGIANSP